MNQRKLKEAHAWKRIAREIEILDYAVVLSHVRWMHEAGRITRATRMKMVRRWFFHLDGKTVHPAYYLQEAQCLTALFLALEAESEDRA
jgi:hypothetical protein